MRRTVEGILMVHDHGYPHVLILQVSTSFFKLPGDYLKPGEDEIEGLRSRLDSRLLHRFQAFSEDIQEWAIGDCVSRWWRPNFETYMYPFIPAHVTQPKECKKTFVVALPEHMVLAVPKNMKLLAIPLFELYENAERYGQQLSTIPNMLSGYDLVML